MLANTCAMMSTMSQACPCVFFEVACCASTSSAPIAILGVLNKTCRAFTQQDEEEKKQGKQRKALIRPDRLFAMFVNQRFIELHVCLATHVAVGSSFIAFRDSFRVVYNNNTSALEDKQPLHHPA